MVYPFFYIYLSGHKMSLLAGRKPSNMEPGFYLLAGTAIKRFIFCVYISFATEDRMEKKLF